MKVYWTFAILAFVVLGAAAVVLGGLNQDEGWYLYAANLVAEGQYPYRDFFYTQGPLLPIIYSAFVRVWQTGGLLGARLFNLAIGGVGILFACALAARLAKSRGAALTAFFLLATNLYHLYYLAIPKTYALAGLFVIVGFYLLSFATSPSCKRWLRTVCVVAAGMSLSFAAGTRISLGAILAVVGLCLLLGRNYRLAMAFGLGGAVGLTLVYGPIVCDEASRVGLLAAQRYHTARGGSDLVWTVGSLSRLVRWYLPIFIVLGLGLKGRGRSLGEVGPLALSFLAVFAVQMLAPFPYEDYQVPIMGLLAVMASVLLTTSTVVSAPSYRFLLVLGLCFASSFGSPLLQDWMTNGQDRFWSQKKPQPELLQLREVARAIEALDPQGQTLLTQDLYLAVEMNRKVPRGLEMGPFAMLDDAAWRKLLADAHETCPVAALSGYTFAIEPPACTERPFETQLDYWRILKKSYDTAFEVKSFGQNATTLLVLKRK